MLVGYLLGLAIGLVAATVSLLMGASAGLPLSFVLAGNIGLMRSAVVASSTGSALSFLAGRRHPSRSTDDIAPQEDRREQMPEPSPPRIASPLLALSGRRVLVVEDELLLFDEMREELEGKGAEVLGPAPSVADALTLLATGPAPDAAILDISLAGEMVYPVAEALRGRGIPFVFATGYDARVMPRGFAQVPRFEKPLHMQSLLHTLAGAIKAA